MPQLLIVRHAIAEERETAARLGLSDAERPLTQKGSKRMKAIAEAITTQVSPPQRILSSPLLRAHQSAELLAAAFPGVDVVIEEGLSPGAPLKQLVAQLHQQTEGGLTLLVGHEPDLSRLISLLLFGKTSADIQLKKGGAALLDFPRGIDAGQAALLWLMTPGQLRSLSD
jgi:phosphohistidine phosphatase